MKSPKFRNNRILRHAIGLLSSLVTVYGIQTESEHLDVVLRALPRGGFGAADAVQEHVVEPGLRRVWRRFSRSAETVARHHGSVIFPRTRQARTAR
jgi:hypothetical protein